MPRFLMCAPDHFGVLYVINPWMDGQIGATTPIESTAQWERIFTAVSEVAEVSLLTATAGLPDLVFTANAALVFGNTAVISRFLFPERQGEEVHAEAWFRAQGFDVKLLPPGVYFEGAGDALFDRGQPLLWLAHGIRSSADALPYLSAWLDVEIQPLTLLRSSFYHLDTCFCPLEGGYLLYYPAAFDGESVRIIEARVPAAMRWAVSEEDAQHFACNAVSVSRRVILNRASPSLRQWLEARSFVVVETPTTEFLKAGGSTKCMTLRLDEPGWAAQVESMPGVFAANTQRVGTGSMEANELTELKEQHEHAAEGNMKPVSFTMALVAVLVAIVTVLGHREHTEAVLQQARASDQWNFYQAKKIRQNDTLLAQDILSVATVQDAAQTAKIVAAYKAHQDKWTADTKESEDKAREYEGEVTKAEAKASKFDFAEALLEIGLVITSITLLTRQRLYWFLGIVFSAVGLVVAAQGFLLH